MVEFTYVVFTLRLYEFSTVCDNSNSRRIT
jgi:hypothetical protein